MHPKSIFCVALQINYIIDTNCVIIHRGTGTAMRKICKQVGRKYKIIFFSTFFFSSLLLPHRSFSTRSILNKQLRKKKVGMNATQSTVILLHIHTKINGYRIAIRLYYTLENRGFCTINRIEIYFFYPYFVVAQILQFCVYSSSKQEFCV